MQSEEIRSPTQVASTLGLIIAQSVFLYSFFYWFGFSAVSEISLVRYFSLLELFTGIADGRLALLLLLLLVAAVWHTILIAQRQRKRGFIDDTSVKMPPVKPRHTSANDVPSPATPSLDQLERYMTSDEVSYFLRWHKSQQLARWSSFLGFAVSLIMVSYLWSIGKRAEGIYLATLTVSFAGTLLAVSNVWAFVALPIRNAVSAVLSFCSLSATVGALDATNLSKGIASTYFPDVLVKTEGATSTGRLIIQTSSATLIFGPLRRFTQIPTAKIVEIKYLPH